MKMHHSPVCVSNTRSEVCSVNGTLSGYLLACILPSETPGPFAVNENTTELVVTAPLDREEVERYRLLLVCRVRTETRITRVETSLDVLVNDEDDNSPFVNGTDTADVVISLNRAKVRGRVSAN